MLTVDGESRAGHQIASDCPWPRYAVAMNRKGVESRRSGRRHSRERARATFECSHETELEICEGCSRDTSLRSRFEFSGRQTGGRRLDRYLQGQKVAGQDCTPDSLLSR